MFGLPPHRQQHVGADLLGGPSSQSHPDRDPVAVRREPDALGAGAHRNPLRLQHAADRLRDIRVLPPDQPRPFLDHCDRRAEAPKDLRELEPDIAAADHHQVPRHTSSASSELFDISGTRSTPGSFGTAARPPTLMKMRPASARRSPPRPRGLSGTARAPRPACSSPCPSACPRAPAAPRAMRSTRALTAPIRPDRPADVTPKSAARRARCAAGAGDQRLRRPAPRFTQVPPKIPPLDDRHPLPGAASRAASDGPAWPPPMTIASNRSLTPPPPPRAPAGAPPYPR